MKIATQFKNQLYTHKFDAVTSDLTDIDYDRLEQEYNLSRGIESTSWKQVRKIAILLQIFRKSSSHDIKHKALMNADAETVKLKLYSPELKIISKHFFNLIYDHRHTCSERHAQIASNYIVEHHESVNFIDKIECLIRSCSHFYWAIDFLKYDNLQSHETKVIRRKHDKSIKIQKNLFQDLNDVESMTLFACKSAIQSNRHAIEGCVARFEKHNFDITTKLKHLLLKAQRC